MLDDHLPDLEILDCTVERTDQDLEKPVLLRFRGRDQAFGTRGADRLFFNPNILNRNLRDLKAISEDRKYPVFHEFAYTTIDTVILSIPEAFRLEAAPSSEDTTTSFGAYRTDFTVSDGRLSHTRTFRLDRNWIPLADHAEYASFLRRVSKSDDAHFVFRRRW